MSCLLTVIGSVQPARDDVMVDWRIEPTHQTVWTDRNRARGFISFDEFRRAYRALHAEDPPRQDAHHWAA